jgi:protein-S-isoprenylcysteine O-methyltransferase Ste14
MPETMRLHLSSDPAMLALAAVAALVLLTYGIAMVRFFRDEPQPSRATRVLSASAAVAAVVQIGALSTATAVSSTAIVIAIGLYGASLAIFWLAIKALGERRLTIAFATDRPASLVDNGIFSRIRHPFYTSYVLAWLAGAVACPVLPVVIVTSAMAAQYLLAARAEERKFAASGLAEDYRRYRGRAGMFWPRTGE